MQALGKPHRYFTIVGVVTAQVVFVVIVIALINNLQQCCPDLTDLPVITANSTFGNA